MGEAKAPHRTVVVLQPGYLPWLGFFDQVRRSDVFVFLDSAQFDRHGWRNRNRIKGEDGGAQWLTVPVRHDGTQPISDVRIDGRMPWARKHVQAIRQCYRRAPYLDRYLPELDAALHLGWDRIAELDIAVGRLMCGWLGLEPTFVRSSDLGLPGRRSELLLQCCLHFGATRYLSGTAAKSYLDVDLLARHGVEVLWQDYSHPTYPQQHDGFVPYLSALDVLLNCGERSAEIIAGGDGAA
jgi:WbqC-like protein family